MLSIINGAFVPVDKAKILITDLAIQRGYGVFDFLKTVDYQPQFLPDHLERFYRSAAALRLPLNTGRSQLEEMIYRLVEHNQLADSGIRLTLTGGYSDDGFGIGTPNLLISQSALLINAQISTTGIKLVTHEHQRQLPHVKTIDYLQAIYLQPFIKEQHADDVLYYHNSMVTECPRSNFFIVTQNDEVLTPANNVLEGVTRKRVLALKNHQVREADISLQDIQHAKEAFITSTTKNVLPVVNIDGNKIGDGLAGKVTKAIYLAITRKAG